MKRTALSARTVLLLMEILRALIRSCTIWTGSSRTRGMAGCCSSVRMAADGVSGAWSAGMGRRAKEVLVRSRVPRAITGPIEPRIRGRFTCSVMLL